MSPVDQTIRFCTAPDGVRIAYATSGEGPPLVKAANWLTHLEYDWQSPVWRHWLQELSRDNLLVRYDQRGCGLSDREADDYSSEAWVSDLEAVVDSLGSDQIDLIGISQGGPAAMTYAVRHPERVAHLVLHGTFAQGRLARKDRPPEAPEEIESLTSLTRIGWGRDNPSYREIFTARFIPVGSREQIDWLNDLQRISTTGDIASALLRATVGLDVSESIPEIRVPTLVVHSRDDAITPFGWGREVAAAIPNSRFVPLDSRNHYLLEHEPAWDVFLSEVRAFLQTPVSGKRAYPDGLSAREAEVLGLIATGKSNREIADELAISVNTADRHVSNILTKIAASNRAEAASYAVRNGLA